MTTATENDLIEISRAMQARLAEVTADLQRDRERRAAKEARIVEVAHREGTENGIGEPLDELLEEFDLPGRPRRVGVRLNLEYVQNIEQTRYNLVFDDGERLPYFHTTGVGNGWGWDRVSDGPYASIRWVEAVTAVVERPRSDESECFCPETDEQGYVDLSTIPVEYLVTLDTSYGLHPDHPLPNGVTVKAHVYNCDGENCHNA